jgi:hypothetical protein
LRDFRLKELEKMGKTTFTALLAAALVGLTVLTLAVPAEAGRGGYGRGYGGGRHHHHYGGGGNAVGAGLLGFGIGAIVGSALTPREVYVAPPPPPPTYYAPAAYGPPAWSPDWYTYCYSRYRSFNPNTGYFIGYDGYPHFCQ